MKLKQHIAISLLFSASLFVVFKSWIVFTSSLISGVLIDLDHVLDYFRENGINLRIKQFFKIFHNKEHSSIVLILHSWELLILLRISAFIVRWNPWIVGTAIGFTQHVVLDQIFNKPSRWAYLFFWRLKSDFNSKTIFPD